MYLFGYAVFLKSPRVSFNLIEFKSFIKSANFHWDNVYIGFAEMSLVRRLWLSELQLCYQLEQFMCHLQLVADVGRRFTESDVELNAAISSLSFSLAFQTSFAFHRNLSHIIPFNTIREMSQFSSSLRRDYFFQI